MSGGRLVVLDRAGREVKRYPLAEGLATLGSDPACDIRVLLPAVSPHHATVVVHANQTVIRNVSTGETLVNGLPVSVAALRHRDTIEIGGRALRWEYSDDTAHRPLAPQPALYSRARGSPRRGRRASAASAAPAPRCAAVRLALELQHRASMPGGVGGVGGVSGVSGVGGVRGKQVAIVQPQRRDTADHTDSSTPPRQNSSAKRSRHSNNDLDSSIGSEPETSKRKSNAARPSPRNTSLQGTTKASLWIESRKSSPRAASLRAGVLRARARAAAHGKVAAPATLDHTKQAAILLMTRHTPKKSASPNQPSFLVKKRTPRASPASSRASTNSSPATDSPIPRASKNSTLDGTPASPARSSRASSNGTLRGSPAPRSAPRPAPRASLRASASVSNVGSPGLGARASRGRPSRALNGTNEELFIELSSSTTSQGSGTPQLSPLLPSPKKSALKDPAAKKASRKTESIKFDLSNLDNYDDQSQDVFFISDLTKKNDTASRSGTDLTLHYESSITSPSPRKSIHSRSSKILEKTLGTSVSEPQSSIRSTLTPESARPRKSSRVSNIIQKALETSGNSRYSQRTTKSLSDESYNTTVASAFKTRTLSPRSPSQKNMESYSIVDLVSVDSNQSGSSSVYNSMQTSRSSDTTFGTPQNSTGRKTRSTIDPTLLTSSTPYVAKTRSSNQRSLSSPNISRNSRNASQSSRGSSRRSKSLSTPENTQKHISVNSTRVSRASRSRSRYDSDLLLISTVTDDDSPKTSKRHNKADKSILSPKSPVISPKRLARTSKSMMSLKSPVTSPKSLSRTSMTVLSLKSPVISPKRLSRGSKSILSPKSPSSGLESSRSKGESSGPKSIRSSPITPVINTNRQSRASKSIISLKSVITSPQRQSRSSKSISSPKSPVSSPKIQNRASKSILSPKSPVISSKRISRSSKSILSPTSPAPSPKRVSRATKSIASPTSPVTSPKSPKSSSKSPKSGTKSNVSSNKNTRKSRRTFAMNTPNGSPGNEGLSTPENRQSPVEVRTPVLSIQRLLDSSKSSLVSQRSAKKVSNSLKRKTFGGIPPKPKKGRASLKSKSFNFGARRTASRLSKESGASDKTVEGTSAQEEDIVTPKSAVKLVQEAVKNKHSTAKKPQSKRSIIDDLNDSDIVKHLFNSPVKRKLSQSMTEFSRKQLFDEEEVVVVKRPTRNTVALGQTPDNSIMLNRTESYTPEVFVSPLGTPNNSPNLTGIKRLFKKQTPENDLRNVKGVKGLLRTPRARRSIRNDLTRVSGVKNVFARSPNNRLSDVRVKEVFAASPRNDLRRVSGVKSLFQSQKKGRKSPKNDLSDVRGVKKLFIASSPANDLRNVSGVKRVLRKNSPRNDLSDVRGVKKMFHQEKERDNMDVSGIEELFNESNNSYRDHSAQLSESLFDKLVGKPPIKAVYSRTFTKKMDKSRKVRRGGSLHVSIDEIIARPEEWIQKELEKRFEKRGANASARELQKLATDTVEGNAPIRTSRIRNSTLVQTVSENAPRKRSTAENYSAHTLPIKKRSLADASLEQGSAGRALPIKKRLLAHSTPVKSRAAALPALARVSPIPPIPPAGGAHRFSTTVVEVPVLQTTRRSTKAKADSPKAKTASPKSKAASPKAKAAPSKAKVTSPETEASSPKAKVATPRVEIVVISPKKTRDKVNIVVSPRNTRKTKNLSVVVSPKTTRKSKNDSVMKNPTLVVTKKAPIMSPNPTRAMKAAVSRSKSKDSANKEAKSPSLQKKGTRKQRIMTELLTEELKPKSPKRTRSKRVSLVVSKPSPKMKPRPDKAQSKVIQTEETSKVQEVPQNTRRTRKTTAPTEDKKTESPKTNTRATRNRKTSEVATKEVTRAAKANGKAQKEPKTNKDKRVEQKPSSKTKGKKVDVSVETNKKELARATRGKKSEASEHNVESPKKGRKTAVEAEKPVVQKRGRKTGDVEPKPNQQKRGRETIEIEEKPASPKRKQKPAVEKSVATRRGRNTEPVFEQKAKSPKRGPKTKAKTGHKPVAQRRGRKTEEVEQKLVSPKRGQKANAKVEKTVAQTRGRKTEVAQKQVKAQTKGKRDTSSKGNISVSPKGNRGKVSEPVQEKKTRGRKAEPEVKAKPTRAASRADTNRKRKSTAADELPAKVRKTRPGDVAGAKAKADANDRATRGRQAPAPTPATRKRKPAPVSPAKAAKAATESSKRAKRVVLAPASPAGRPARAKADSKVAKRSTRGKR